MGPGFENEVIIFRENDLPSEVAQDFTFRFDLGPNAAKILENQILTALDQQKPQKQ
jgi:hypothetical protein